MNKKVILLVSVVALFTSCNQAKKDKLVAVVAENNNIVIETNREPSDGYTLMKNNCYACHNPNTSSHDDILAPPLKAVKMHYNREYDTKEDFVNAMVNWVQNPEEDKALMFGAVRRFKVMPKLPLPTKDLEKIAKYIYENDVDEPEWMEDHMNEKHGDNMGNGQGQGKGNGKEKMKNGEKGCNHKDGKSCVNGC
ncbi:MAG: c-type cytochrome [Xanthomarina gelatinilytica]|nr:c-type cytochrome [Xanthomarina gelatinilytica]